MIYECVPESVERIWGSLPPSRAGGEPIGEVWWFYGETLLRSSGGPAGKASEFFPSGEAPVILKTLHPANDLSVQVHPGKNRKPPMKDESWAVLSGTGRILHGIREGTRAEDFARAVKGGFVESRLLEFRASPGDLFHLPAGTVHALGAGLTVLEIQLACPVTYRLWDYDRKDIHGNTRELHVKQGLDAVDWSRMGRALKMEGPLMDGGFYSLEIVRSGVVEMGPMELFYDTLRKRCLFADREGGRAKTGGEGWRVRIKNGNG